MDIMKNSAAMTCVWIFLGILTILVGAWTEKLHRDKQAQSTRTIIKLQNDSNVNQAEYYKMQAEYNRTLLSRFFRLSRG